MGNYIKQTGHNNTEIVIDGEFTIVRNLLAGEARYEEYVKQYPDKKIALVCHDLVYRANYDVQDNHI